MGVREMRGQLARSPGNHAAAAVVVAIGLLGLSLPAQLVFRQSTAEVEELQL